jgi:hypothetical protein
MEYMYPLFRGVVLGQEVQCLKVLGLRLRDHTVVVPGGVQVIVNTTKFRGGGFQSYNSSGPRFLLVVIAFLK